MKRKVKKYAGGNLVDSSGNPVRSGSGEPVRTRSDDEIAEDSKAGYGRYMPKTRSYSMDDVKSGIGKLLGGKSSDTEERSMAGPQDYETMGKKAGITSPFLKENITESSKANEESETLTKPFSSFKSGESKFERKDNEVIEKKKPAKKKIVSKKDLEESGLSLRDYMNKERGLTRKGMASGGKTSSASSRGDGIAMRGKTKGRIC